jgi:hypothetical protein
LTQFWAAGMPVSMYFCSAMRSRMPSVTISPVLVTGMNCLAWPTAKFS